MTTADFEAEGQALLKPATNYWEDVFELPIEVLKECGFLGLRINKDWMTHALFEYKGIGFKLIKIKGTGTGEYWVANFENFAFQTAVTERYYTAHQTLALQIALIDLIGAERLKDEP